MTAHTHTRALPTETLYTAARELNALLPRLQATLTDTDTDTTPDNLGANKRVAAPIPWNNTAAMLYLEIHGDARTHENALNARLFKKTRYRPGDDNNTRECIARLPVLLDHAQATLNDPDDLTDIHTIARALTSWPRRIRAHLDEARPDEAPWTRAPGGLTCPYCDRVLELEPGWQHHTENADVVCRRCNDAHGRFLRWAPTTWLAVLQQDAG